MVSVNLALLLENLLEVVDASKENESLRMELGGIRFLTFGKALWSVAIPQNATIIKDMVAVA